MLYKPLMYIRLNKAALKGRLFKLLYQSKHVKIGSNFKCDSFPDLQITQNGQLIIEDNVTFKRNVEVRAHNDAAITIGSNVRIDRGVRILGANESKILLDDGARIGLYSVINGGDSVKIGKKCLISGFVYLQTSMHRYNNDGPIQDQGYSHAPITLEEDVWLGAHVVILPGVQMGQGAIVGSNSVVRKSVESGQIVGGVPAKILKDRTNS